MLTLALLIAVSASADTVEEMLAQFNKYKHVSKEKRGVKKEKYADVRSELVVHRDRTKYSGTYDATGFGHAMTLDVRADGTVRGNGTDDGREFELANGRIEGALLTATKVYRDGGTEPLRGIFINRRSIHGKSPDRIETDTTAFGLGVTDLDVHFAGMTLERLFYERQ